MESTLDKLLSIAGCQIGAQKGPYKREEERKGIPPPQPPTGPGRDQNDPKSGIYEPPTVKPSPEDLETWREAFRIFSRYAPALKAAAATDGELNEAACEIFAEAGQRVVAMVEPGGDAQIVALRVYDMLDDVWREARKAAGKLQE